MIKSVHIAHEIERIDDDETVPLLQRSAPAAFEMERQAVLRRFNLSYVYSFLKDIFFTCRQSTTLAPPSSDVERRGSRGSVQFG